MLTNSTTLSDKSKLQLADHLHEIANGIKAGTVIPTRMVTSGEPANVELTTITDPKDRGATYVNTLSFSYVIGEGKRAPLEPVGVIRSWDELGVILGVKPKTLHMQWKRGKLPLTEMWDKGTRVFDRKEVEALKAAQANQE